MKYKRICTVLIFFLLIFTSSTVLADESKKITDKIDKQNSTLIDKLKKDDDRKNNDFEDAMKTLEDKHKTSETIDLSKVSKNLQNLSYMASVKARKYVIVLTVVTILIYTLLIVTVGSKNLSKRKSYIWGCIIAFIFFLTVLNFPIFLLWYRANGIKLNSIYDGAFNFYYFMNENSTIICLILMIYGAINLIMEKTDISKQLLGKYLINASIAMFIIIKSLLIMIRLSI